MFSVDKLTYAIIPGKPLNSRCPVPLYSNLYSHWLTFWTEEYKSYGSGAVDPNNFFRQDKYTAILDGDVIVATHALTGFDLKYPIESYSYFAEMQTPEILKQLKETGRSRFWTLQYFMVNPEYSPRKTLLNLGAVMVALSLKHIGKMDGCLSAARSGVAAASLAIKLGFEKVSDDYIVHNVPVTSLFCSHPVPYRREEENSLIEKLWNERIDYTMEGVTYDKSERVARQGSGSLVRPDEEISL